MGKEERRTEGDVPTVEPGGRDSGDEELRAVGVPASVGHGQQSRLGVLQLEVLVGELVAVNCNVNMLAMGKDEILPIGSNVLDLPPVPSPLVKSPP